MVLLSILVTQTLLFPPQPDIYLDVVSSEHEKPWAFMAPHENEHVVNQYVAEKITQYGGTFVVLRQTGSRHIKLKVAGKELEIDPNRIFTDRGRHNTLSRLNPELKHSSPQFTTALDRTEQLADFIMTIMKADQASSWIAIHNNTNGYDGDGNNGRGTISIKRYQKKLDAGAKYLIKVNDAGIDEDNLFFITEFSDYKAMVDANWNVVLQNPAVATDPNEDDGSLSVLAEMNDKRYVNIEAERADDGFGEDNIEEQKQMVDLMFKLLIQTNNKTP